jgi:hypothetical protein
MAQIIDLEGLPEPVANALIETVIHLKREYGETTSKSPKKPERELPSRPGKVIGSLRRVDLYEER